MTDSGYLRFHHLTYTSPSLNISGLFWGLVNSLINGSSCNLPIIHYQSTTLHHSRAQINIKIQVGLGWHINFRDKWGIQNIKNGGKYTNLVGTGYPSFIFAFLDEYRSFGGFKKMEINQVLCLFLHFVTLPKLKYKLRDIKVYLQHNL